LASNLRTPFSAEGEETGFFVRTGTFFLFAILSIGFIVITIESDEELHIFSGGNMEHTHYLLQDWLAWWQSVGVPLVSSALCSFEKNALANFWRDIGNLITGLGAGWAATRESFFNLFGADLPTQQPRSGDEAVRNTVSNFIKQALGELFGGSQQSAPSSGSAQPSLGDLLGPEVTGSGTTPTGSAGPQPSLSDLLPPEMGGTSGTTHSGGTNNPFADFLPPETPGGKRD
jgi:hypothetical protein